MSATDTLFPELEPAEHVTTPPEPLEEKDFLAAFERWMTSRDGRAFFAAFDPMARQGGEGAMVWLTIHKALDRCRVRFDHDYQPLVPRLWMLYRNRPGYFKTCKLYRYTETEVTATCERILKAWKGEAQ